MSTGFIWNLQLARTGGISLFFIGILALATWKRYSTTAGEVWESHLFLGEVGLVVLWASVLNGPHHMRSDMEFSTYNVSNFRHVVKKFRFCRRTHSYKFPLNSTCVCCIYIYYICIYTYYIYTYTSFIFWMKFRITT